ncbi:MAG: GHMP family kinase ATP-binding protein [Planctomycetota bacterium]|jgi:D-glycero-alpha-D-manno-heptose-7-phosphate kinase
MIISQTPFRVSFAGGGTDLPAYYHRDYGAVLSVTIGRHMYVTVHHRFDSTIRVAYSRTETADDVESVQHTIVREALRTTGLGRHLEITTIGDVPAGTGMGSSSALTVGLLNALYAYGGKIVNRDRLAREACEIEIDTLAHPIGKQDQYASAFGGVNYIRFNPDETVVVDPVPLGPGTRAELESRVLLLFTDRRRAANDILEKQSAGTADRSAVLTEMRDLADAMRRSLTGRVDLDEFAALLHTGWELKRSLGFGISDESIDGWYEAGRRAGAQGGKLLGAGGGGFLLLVAPPERHEAIREALGRPRELTFDIDPRGSRIVFISDHH